MAKPSLMADDQHVVRHCKKRLVIFKNGQAVGFHPELLELRPPTKDRGQETYASVTHYEFYQGNHLARMKACCQATPTVKKPKDRMVRLNAGCLKRHGTYGAYKVRVLHMPKATRKSYAGVHGLPIKLDVDLNNKLLTQCVIDHEAVEAL
jgi:hypothetical protein